MTTDASAHAHQSRRRTRALVGLTLAFLVLGLSYLGYWLLVGRFYVSTDDAYVGGNLVALTARVTGSVTSISADDTDLVWAGSPLVVLDPTTARLRLKTRESALAYTIRHARARRAEWAALKARASAASILYQKARDQERRRTHLAAIHAISPEAWRDTKAQTAVMKARYLDMKARARALSDEVGATPLASLPAIQKAAAAVEQAYAELQRCIIRAPVTGYVAKRHVQLGEHIKPGQTLMVIIPLQALWITANFKETALGDLRIGQPARVVADIYGNRAPYQGRVIGIGAGTGSAFALLPPSNASGNWIKIVQRVPVRISLAPTALDHHPLRVGLSATVTVDIHNRTGRMLSATPSQTPILQTHTYGHSVSEARALVRHILRLNGARPGG